MTFLPLADRDVVGAAGPEYEPQRRCSHPLCEKNNELQNHHLWRRSFLQGAFNWVRLPSAFKHRCMGGLEGNCEKDCGPTEGRVVGNKVYLCPEHHAEITDNKAGIYWDVDRFIWKSPSGGGWFVQPLSPQPPLSLEAFESVRSQVPEHDSHSSVPENAVCPTCNRRVPKKKEPSELEPERKRTTISFRAPADSEDGVEIIDTLLEECAKLFGRDTVNDETGKELRGWKYFVLVEALALVVQHGHLLTGEGEAA